MCVVELPGWLTEGKAPEEANYMMQNVLAAWLETGNRD